MSSHHSHLSFAFGVLGNISSFFCFLAPLPTFYRVWKRKSTEGFQSIPYVAALFSAMLWLFYAYMKTGETLLITINAFGCVIETIYLAIYVTYCPRKVRMSTVKMIVLMNFVGFGAIVVLTHVIFEDEKQRIKLLGWICVVFATSVFAAPLSIIRVVIRTKSVEFLPFPLSLLLLISAIMWLLYGLSLKDIYVTLPNVVGLTFGIVQITLYAIYRNSTPVNNDQLPEHKDDVINDELETSNDDEKKIEVKVDIEIVEKKEEERDDKEKKMEQQVTEEKTEEKENINSNKKTEEVIKGGCEV
jgi:solute carrier family 50 protein (sugar transporter)